MSGYYRASARLVLLLLVTLAAAGCSYGFTGGGGFPSHIRTLYIAPLQNDTRQFDVDQQVYRALRERLPRALGVREAPERSADAVLRATIMRYEDMAQTRPGEPGTVERVQNQVQITMSIQVVDVQNNEIIFESSGISGRGEYQPESQSDEVARARAIELLIQQIIDSAQSQW